MMEQLKPCPFCGRTDTLHFDRYKSDGEWWGYIECTECIMTGPVGKLKEDAVDAWNRRADEEKSLARELIKTYTNVHFDEWTLSKKIYKSKCRYCGGDLEMYTHEDRNIIGDKGFTTVLCCKGCAGNVKIFSRTADQIPDAEHKALECFGIKENDK